MLELSALRNGNGHQPSWSGHLPHWVDFITIAPELRLSVHTAQSAGRCERVLRKTSRGVAGRRCFCRSHAREV